MIKIYKIAGKTFNAKDLLKEAEGKFNSQEKVWEVPADKWDALVAKKKHHSWGMSTMKAFAGIFIKDTIEA